MEVGNQANIPRLNSRGLGPQKIRSVRSLGKNIKKDKYLLMLILPVFIYYIVFHYIPMYGAVIAFKDFIPNKGIWGSPWVGFQWFEEFFSSIYFWRLIKNTILMSLYGLLWGFPIPIVFALMLNEVKDGIFKRCVQTISYLPHFISVVIVVGLMINFLSPVDGVINSAIKALGGTPIAFLNEPGWFRTLFIASGIWQGFGWGSIVFLSSISAIDPQLYEASKMDGANRLQQIFNITIPGIFPTIVIMLILSIGNLLNVGFEKIILMYNTATYETADVISTYVYRSGITNSDYSFATAVGFFNSVINFILLAISNKISKKITEISLW